MEQKQNISQGWEWLEELPLLNVAQDIEHRPAAEQIKCVVRKKWLNATGEEWVRQTLVVYLSKTMNISLGRFSMEKKSHAKELHRYDIMIHTPSGAPWLLIECKAPHEVWRPHMAYQIMQYQETVQAQYLMWCNGTSAWLYDRSSDRFLKNLNDLKGQYS